MQRKLGNIHEYIVIYIQQQKKCVHEDTVWGSASVNPKKNIHGGGRDVLSEQLWWDYFRECFGITPLGKLLSWESSCVVQGHTEISAAQFAC